MCDDGGGGGGMTVRRIIFKLSGLTTTLSVLFSSSGSRSPVWFSGSLLWFTLNILAAHATVLS